MVIRVCTLIVVAIMPFSSSQASSGLPETDEFKNEEWVVTLIDHEDRPHSLWENRIVREYVFSARNRAANSDRTIRVGGDFLEAAEKLEGVRLFGDHLITMTANDIVIADLNTGAILKRILARDWEVSPSGRFIAFFDWQTRATRPEHAGVVVSLLDLKKLEFRWVFPEESRLSFAKPQRDPLLQPYRLDFGSPPSEQCHAHKLYWSEDSRRLSFVCYYYLTPDGRFPMSSDGFRYGMVVVTVAPDLTTHFQRFPIPVESFLLSSGDPPERAALLRVQDLRWHESQVLEIDLDKPWARDKIYLNIETGEISPANKWAGEFETIRHSP